MYDIRLRSVFRFWWFQDYKFKIVMANLRPGMKDPPQECEKWEKIHMNYIVVVRGMQRGGRRRRCSGFALEKKKVVCTRITANFVPIKECVATMHCITGYNVSNFVCMSRFILHNPPEMV